MRESQPAMEGAKATQPGNAGTEDRQPLWNLPNQLTIARFLLAVIFFLLLALENHGFFSPQTGAFFLNVSVAIFILAVLTDFLDGYLARRWGQTSAFGRIADTFTDKILICGGLVMLTSLPHGIVHPWYAVLILMRELLVSGLRSFFESQGVAFGAMMSGKIKMLAQSATIPAVLLYEANFPLRAAGAPATLWEQTLRWTALGLLAVTLLSTVASCVSYVRRAVEVVRAGSTAR